MWDNTMKGQSNEVHTDTLERISLEKNIQKLLKKLKIRKKQDNRLDEPHNQILSYDSDEALNPYFRGYDSRTATSKLIIPGDILKYYSPIFVFII